VKAAAAPALLGESATMAGIATCHSIFNVLCTLLLMPMAGLLEKLVMVLIPDQKVPETQTRLDERLLATPAVALEQCHQVSCEMAVCAVEALRGSLTALGEYTPALADGVRQGEEQTDRYEDLLGSYLVKLSTLQIGEEESGEAAMLLKVIGDFERISDHSVNVLESVEELRNKKLAFTEAAARELAVLTAAVEEILSLSLCAFAEDDEKALMAIAPLEQVIDNLKEQMRTNHILRLQQGLCTIETGFVWSDLLTDLERVSDHCANIAGCLIDRQNHDMNRHEHLRSLKTDHSGFREAVAVYAAKYRLA